MQSQYISTKAVTARPPVADVVSAQSLDSFAALPSNFEAIKTGLQFARGQSPFVAIIGPTGWGKSHLLEEVTSQMGNSIKAKQLTLQSLLRSPSRYEANQVLIIDDAEEMLGKTRVRQEFRLQLERRVRSGRPTALAFTADQPTRQLRNLLPSAREWAIGSLRKPQAAERVPLLQHMAAREGLFIADQLSRVIAYRMKGNGRTLAGALKRLKLSGKTWKTHTQVLQACGLLDPFFADCGDWDLPRHIVDSANVWSQKNTDIPAIDLALYAMLCVAELPEADCACAAMVAPAQAYKRTKKLHKKVIACEATGRTVEAFTKSVVESLV